MRCIIGWRLEQGALEKAERLLNWLHGSVAAK
jgi:hypothetical protein